MRANVTRAEIAALLAVAQDYAFAQPPGSQLRATVLGQHLAIAAGAHPDEQATTWWTSTLRYLGCTGHSFETTVLFGDDVELRGASLRADFADPLEVLRLMLARAGSDRAGVDRVRSLLTVIAGGRQAAATNFRTACEVADLFAARLGLDEPVRVALAATFERWNGRGLPTGSAGEAIPQPMRIAHLSQELEVLARLTGIDDALTIIRARRGGAYDPRLADLVLEQGRTWWSAVETADSWDAALAVAPRCTPLDDAGAHACLLVLADFADLKSPWTRGHSRQVAALARDASGPLAEAAALVHDLGKVAVPNTISDKPGPLTRDERDRAEAHALVTDQLLRRLPYTSTLAPVAGAAHERLDGSGYHRRLTGANLDGPQRVLAAADTYQAMTSGRPNRPPLTSTEAARALRAMSAAGALDGEAVERVLNAAGHKRAPRPPQPAGLTLRETEVLQLLTRGLTTRQIAHSLVISVKTADHHIQHVYAKIGVSTRGAAALFAIENGLVPTTLS